MDSSRKTTHPNLHKIRMVMNITSPTPSTEPINDWLEMFLKFYKENENFPIDLGFAAFFYGLSLLLIIYIISLTNFE